MHYFATLITTMYDDRKEKHSLLAPVSPMYKSWYLFFVAYSDLV